MKKLALLLAVLVSLPAAAQLYKWKDANGKIHYGDRPQEGASASEIAARPQSFSPVGSAASTPDWKQRDEASRAKWQSSKADAERMEESQRANAKTSQARQAADANAELERQRAIAAAAGERARLQQGR